MEEGASTTTTTTSEKSAASGGGGTGGGLVVVETSGKMVESDSQQQLPAAPPVPESDESTTTNPSMNGLEASSVSSPAPRLDQHVTMHASTSSSSSSTAASPAVLLGAALSMEEAAAPSANTQPSSSGVAGDAANKGSSSGGNGKTGTPKGATGLATGDAEEKRVGCAHYKRRAKFVTPCCNKLYMCRYCHDESESHYFNRKTVTQLICTECDTRQRVQAECEKCGVRFGKYTCLVCNLFDDEDKNQYHCDGCGICRVGGKDRFFHCEVCNMCLPIQLKIDGHRCVENVSRSNCPVCLEDIHTSRIPCHIPDCGHLLHRTCFEELLSSGHYACPTCQTSMIEMKKLWDYLDAEVENTPMPNEYASYLVDILCKDCHKESNIPYHVVGLKCAHCGAYNTCQTNKSGTTGGGGGVPGSRGAAAAGEAIVAAGVAAAGVAALERRQDGDDNEDEDNEEGGGQQSPPQQPPSTS